MLIRKRKARETGRHNILRKGKCDKCDFKFTGDSIEDLDARFRPHAEVKGHSTYHFGTDYMDRKRTMGA